MTVLRALSMAGLVCLAGGVVAGAPNARADDCDMAVTAAIAQAKVPHAITHEVTVPGRPPMQAEMIVTETTVYAQVNGDWRSSPFSSQQQIDQINAAKQRGEQTPHTCRNGGTQPINGQAATLVLIHTEADGKVSDTSIWVSKATGLPLKSEIRLGDGTLVTNEFRYGNIRPPPGVQ